MGKIMNYIEEHRYGEKPVELGHVPLDVQEMMAYLYLPVCAEGLLHTSLYVASVDDARVFKNFGLLMDLCIADYTENFGPVEYAYVSAKRIYCTPENPGNRPGYHCDGFLSDDVNYVWSDCYSTVFCLQEYENVIQDHMKSMEVFDEQSREENTVSYPNCTLLRLSPYVVHRTPDLPHGMMRTFFKMSFSKHKYNLKGNSINSLNEKWKMNERSEVRNHPIYNEVDFVPE